MKRRRERGDRHVEDDARLDIYGEPYAEWQAKYQREANADQLAKFQIEAQKHTT